MALPTSADVTKLDLSEASYYGVGVYLADGDDVECLLAPGAFPDWPESAASWAFSETLCARLEARI